MESYSNELHTTFTFHLRSTTLKSNMDKTIMSDKVTNLDLNVLL